MTVTRVFRGVGELFLTVGTLLVLYVVYTVVWTNVEADQRSSHIVDDLRKQWATTAPRPPAATAPTATPTQGATRPPAPKAPANGAGLALMVIPRLGGSWVSPVLEGVGDRSLTRGLGHYPRTALPGEVGNFSVAGHRATNGEPFARLDRVVKGDHVYVQTSTAWHDYVVDSTAIVAPTETSVVLPVPKRPGAKPTERKMTLTTCHPRWGSTQRLIVFTTLAATTPASAGPPAGAAVA